MHLHEERGLEPIAQVQKNSPFSHHFSQAGFFLLLPIPLSDPKLFFPPSLSPFPFFPILISQGGNGLPPPFASTPVRTQFPFLSFVRLFPSSLFQDRPLGAFLAVQGAFWLAT